MFSSALTMTLLSFCVGAAAGLAISRLVPSAKHENNEEEQPKRRLMDYQPALAAMGKAKVAGQIKSTFRDAEAHVIRVALTGGPCAGKSSALPVLMEAATKDGFDVYVAPEVATLLLNSGCGGMFPPENNPRHTLFRYEFQTSILKMQLMMERCMIKIAARTGRPSIIVFDRGLMDCKAYLSDEMWASCMADAEREQDKSLHPDTINEEYILGRYDAAIHLVTAADGTDFYKSGKVADDDGNKVTRLENAEEAIKLDRRLQSVWAPHKRHFVINNDGDFSTKLNKTKDAVLSVAHTVHPQIQAPLSL